MQVSVHKFRSFYKQEGITQQKMTSRLGGKKLPSQQRQMQAIQELQARVVTL